MAESEVHLATLRPRLVLAPQPGKAGPLVSLATAAGVVEPSACPQRGPSTASRRRFLCPTPHLPTCPLLDSPLRRWRTWQRHILLPRGNPSSSLGRCPRPTHHPPPQPNRPSPCPSPCPPAPLPDRRGITFPPAPPSAPRSPSSPPHPKPADRAHLPPPLQRRRAMSARASSRSKARWGIIKCKKRDWSRWRKKGCRWARRIVRITFS